MNIQDWPEKIKPYFRLIVIILLGFLGLGLYKLAHIRASEPLKIVTMGQSLETLSNGSQNSQNVVASKTGTKYYLPWCGALNRIKPENRVEFATVALARSAGYLPAGNCKGVK